MGRVICISSQKGGVGKTTTAVNLSTGLALAEKACLLVDSDPQGHATLGLEAIHENGNGKKNLWHAMAGRIPVREAVAHTGLGFLHLLPANRELLRAEAELPRMGEKESRLKRVLDELRPAYDFILIDTPPSLGLLTVNGLVAADSLLIPLQCGFYAFAGLRHYAKFAAVVKEHLNPSLQLEGLLLSMLLPEQDFSLRIEDAARACLGSRLLRTVIPWDSAIPESSERRTPVLLQDMSSPCSRLYLALAGEVMGRTQAVDAFWDRDILSLAGCTASAGDRKEVLQAKG